MKAFEVHALDYLLKPVGKDRLSEALGHARKQLSHPSEATFQRKLLDLLADLESRQQTPQRIVIKADGEIVCLKPNEIDWAESAGNYVCLHVGRQHPHSAGNDHLAGIAIGTPAIPARAPFHAGECGPHQDLAALAVWRLFHSAARRHQADAEPRLPGECAEAAGDGVGRLGAISRSFRMSGKVGVPILSPLLRKGGRKTARRSPARFIVRSAVSGPRALLWVRFACCVAGRWPSASSSSWAMESTRLASLIST